MKFLSLLKKLLKFSEHRQHKMSCIIAKKNKVVGMGFNKLSTHPKSLHPFRMCHAELSALLKSRDEDLSGATAYVYRQRRDGSPALARPCKYCEAALIEAGIRKIYYSVEHEPFYQYEEIA